ncbi:MULTISPECIES: hypothetical protein [Pseudomonas]|uniref:DUF7660 domain-containing protein n=1 Tax=Pseudomonas gingeri TaxID=117681 RepID=A0A7Y7WL68_9PSED|nr:MULTISPECIES: hypothetical protein [Pseudomonas]NWB51291.1 hypothetical protein [Pseudomonas gingeri]
MIDKIETKEDFAEFIGKLRSELLNAPEEWENTTLERFLESMEAWIKAIDMYSKNTGDTEVLVPSWNTFAKIFCAAKIYE